MGNKMLIDAAHPEETRVVVLRGNRIEEFDFEAASKKQLRGNIYLAKVTRVEPSLQAAFIEYGGNRHGFLAFSEIHPDYYQIPIADRQALLEEEARHQEDEESEEPRSSNAGGRENGNGGGGRRSRRHRRGGNQGSAEKRTARSDEFVASDEIAEGEAAAPGADVDLAGATEEAGLRSGEERDVGSADAAPVPIEATDEPAEGEAAALTGDAESVASDEGEDHHDEVTTLEHGAEQEAPVDIESKRTPDDGHDEQNHEDDVVEQLGGDALEDVPHRVSRPRRNYKIQEVIKRRQVLLVQVVKEERGNKGAALTTYLSLAGRYSVLMPNTAKGGGISRKITDAEDRKRLKAIAQELEVPEGMGIILRTAGAARGMPEVKRDFEYLMRMWETVRETTLKSSAPTLVYEEGSLIKRSIRDLFNKDVDEVLVAGEEGYREARDFMRLLMPSQTKNVIPYRDQQPIFAKAGAEAQLDAMFSNQVTLKSGGYLVINQTEALVAIDVNSGRSTREHNIEDTALRTNLEAADEVARQLRLRDLAGLIVVDFIDMEEGRNDRAVERRIKDALKNDRARIQIGRISHFGLLEMSRQRMRTGVLEGSTVMCQHCAGSGTVRSISSIALHVLRMLEDALIKSAAHNLVVRTRSEVALYILNQKRVNLLDLESRFGVSVTVVADPAMTGTVYHAIERGGDATPPHFLSFQPNGARSDAALQAEEEEEDLELLATEEAEDEETVAEDVVVMPSEAIARDGQRRPGEGQRAPADGEGEGGRRRKRRRRRRGGRDGQPGSAGQDNVSGEAGNEQSTQGESFDEGGELDNDNLSDIESGFAPGDVTAMDEAVDAAPSGEDPAALTAEAAPAEPADATPVAAQPAEVAPLDEVVEAPRRRRSRRSASAAETTAGDAAEAPATAVTPARRPRRSRARIVEETLDLEAAAAPSADRDVGADTAKQHPTSAAPREPELPLMALVKEIVAPDQDVAPAVPVQAATPEPVAPAEEDPNRPKRSGWWQRAKATFGS